MPTLLIYLMIIASLLIIYLIIEAVELKCIRFTYDKIDTGVGIRVALLGDLHNNHLSARTLKRLEDHKPDKILICGDLLNKRSKDTVNASEALQRLSEIAEVIYALGNHELRIKASSPQVWDAFIKTIPHNVKLLDDDVYHVSDHLTVYGASLDQGFYRKFSFHDTTNVPSEVFKEHDTISTRLLLAHHPAYVDHYRRMCAPDLILSGHLHGGFIRLPFVGGVIFTDTHKPHYSAGLYEIEAKEDLPATKLFVTKGLGDHFIPMRLFDRCEINILDI